MRSARKRRLQRRRASPQCLPVTASAAWSRLASGADPTGLTCLERIIVAISVANQADRRRSCDRLLVRIRATAAAPALAMCRTGTLLRRRIESERERLTGEWRLMGGAITHRQVRPTITAGCAVQPAFGAYLRAPTGIRHRPAFSSSPSPATGSAPSPASTTACSHGSGSRDHSLVDNPLSECAPPRGYERATTQPGCLQGADDRVPNTRPTT